MKDRKKKKPKKPVPNHPWKDMGLYRDRGIIPRGW